jgi:hypothetical protein
MSFDFENADFVADKLEAELLPKQEIRESVHNELEAITRRAAEKLAAGEPYEPWLRVGVDWTYIDAEVASGKEPVWRLSVLGNGDGMTRAEVERYAKTLAVSGANNNQGKGGNQGMGLKISGPTRHPAGVAIRTLRNGEATMCKLGRDPKSGYDFLPIGANGEKTIDISRSVERLFPPEILEAGAGTIVTFHGVTGTEDTLLGQPSNWVEKYLNTRYGVLDGNIDFKVEVPVGQGRPKVVTSSQTNQDMISGRLKDSETMYFKPSSVLGTCAVWSEASDWYRDQSGLEHPTHGTVNCVGDPSRDIPPARIHYWCFPEEGKKGRDVTSRTAGPGRIAVIFQGELHDWREGIGSNALFARFGIVFGKSRVSLVLEPVGDYDEVDSDFARAHVMLARFKTPVMEHDDALTTWSNQFKEQMPEGIKAVIRAARQESLGDQTVTTEVMKRIADMLKRLRPQRYRRQSGGPVRAGGEVGGAGNGRAEGDGTKRTSVSAPPTSAGDDALLALLDEEGEEAVDAQNPPLRMHAEWKSEDWINSQAVVGGHDVTDRAAALIGASASTADLLALNEDFRGFTRFVDELDREMNPNGDDDLRQIIEMKCREYTLQKMLEAVLGVRQLENGNQWMANEIQDALGPTALTTAFMADRYHTWQSVKRVVGSKANQIRAAAAPA